MSKTFLTLAFSALMLGLCNTNLYAQREISGKVVDKKDAPVGNASVVAKGTTSGGVADASGNFKMILPEGKNTVVANFGDETVEASVPDNQNTVTLKFKSTVKDLQKRLDKIKSGKAKKKKK